MEYALKRILNNHNNHKNRNIGYDSIFLDSCREGYIHLVEKFFDYNEINKGLIIACKYGYLDIVMFLIEQGADIHYNNEEPLLTAILNNKVGTFKLLIKKGAIINVNYNAPIRHCTNIEIMKVLIKKGADIHSNKEECLLNNIRIDNVNCVEYLIQQGADIFIDCCYPLVLACELGSLNCVELLLECGSDIHVCYDRPIRHAIKFDKPYICELLLSKGADKNIYLNSLLCNKIKNRENIRRILKEEDVDINNNDPLKIAISTNQIEVVQLLLDIGFKIDKEIAKDNLEIYDILLKNEELNY